VLLFVSQQSGRYYYDARLAHAAEEESSLDDIVAQHAEGGHDQLPTNCFCESVRIKVHLY